MGSQASDSGNEVTREKLRHVKLLEHCTFAFSLRQPGEPTVEKRRVPVCVWVCQCGLIKGWYNADGRSNQMIAIFADGNFVVMPTFSGRVRHLGNAGLALDHVGFSYKGNYSVDVHIPHVSGTYTRAHRSVYLEVTAPPTTRTGELMASQSRHALYSKVTANWHVALTCGMFTDLGHPSVDVLWKTPSGSSLPSSNYDNGYFELLLDNPVEGGNYSCRLNPSSPAAVCLHSDDPMMKEVKVTVDEVKARLTLIEAHQGALQSEMRMENADLKRKNANLTQYVHSLETNVHSLENNVHSLETSIHFLETQLDQYHIDNASMTDHVHSLENDVHRLETQLDQYHRDNTNLTNYVHNLQAELSHFQEAAFASVSFHARLSFSGSQVSDPNPVILTDVISNQGGAYSSTTGQFTVPRNGSYVFYVSLGAGSPSPPVAGVYVIMDSDVVCLTHSYYVTSVQGSSCHAVLHLAQGQRVWLKAYGTSFFWAYGTFFGGFLLHADA